MESTTQRLLANRQFPPRNLRDAGARTSPGPIQTRNLNANPRFSYTETPVLAQSEVFSQPQIFQQFSSPTNSTIDESPITPYTQQATPYISENQRRSPFPEEKAVPARIDSPYNAVATDEVHPAHFAPYAEASPFQPHPASTPYQLSTIPPRSQSSEPSHTRGGSNTKATQSVPFLNITDSDRKQDIHQPQFTPKTPTYNPDSVSGPNGALENHRPGQVSHPNAAIQPEWKHGLCELDTLCCTGLFCPCTVYGKTQYRLAQKSQRREATDLLGYESFNSSCGIMAAACGVQWVFALIQHTRIRKLYKLNGSIGDDCIKSLCCCCCVIMQNEREVKGREELIRRHAGPASGAYISPDPMNYAPPPR